MHWKKWSDKAAPAVRSGVGRANGTMKQWHGMGRVRYRGLKRNHCHLQFVCAAMNMKRALVLLKAA